MNRKVEIGLSKFMSKILRHEAKHYGLEQDKDNFVDLNDFLNVVKKEFRGEITVFDIYDLLENSVKDGQHRFQVVGNKVRATYNHTWKYKGDRK